VFGWISANREITVRIFVRVLFGATLALLTLRDYIFGDGLYIYRDTSWPLSTAVFPQAVFSPNAIANATPDPFGFSRVFLTWPILIINHFSSDVIITQKLFIIYLFGTFLILALALAQISLKLINKASRRQLSFWRGEFFSLTLGLLMFANFWSIQQLSGLYFTYVIEFLLLLIGLALVLLEGSSYRSILAAGGLLSLSIFLDPDLFMHELVAFAVAILAISLLKSFSKTSCLAAVSKIATLVLLCLPALLTMLYILQQTTGTQIRPPGLYQITTRNLSLSNAARLLGYDWSVIAYAPPSILTQGSSLSSLGTIGSPPFMVFPNGWITLFWFVTTWSLPVFSFSALLLRRYWRITLPSCCVAVVGILLTQPSLFPIPYDLVSALATTPIIGGALATQYALPDHILIIVAAAYVLMTAVGIHFLLSIEFDRIRRFHLPLRLSPRTARYARRGAHFLIVAMTISLLIFPSWQLFSGSFFPAGYADGLPGNGIPGIGTFTPSVPPKQMFEAYQWLMSQPGNFNVYWPGAEGSTYPWSEKSTPSIAWVDSPKPSYVTTTTPSLIFPVGLQYLIAKASSYDLSDYLRALDIRYLVLQPSSEPAVEAAWGVSNITTVSDKLNNAEGITLALQFGDISVYEVSGLWGESYSPNVVASFPPGDETYTLAYGILGSLGSLSAIVPSGSPTRLCFDASSCGISIYSTEFVANQMSPDLVFNTPTGSGGTNTFELAANSHVQIPSPWVPWTLTNWGSGNSTISVTNNMTQWNFPATLTTLSLSYNGTVTNLNPGGITVPSGQLAMVRVGFSYKMSESTDVALRVVIPTLNDNESFVADVTSPQFAPSDEWTYATFNDTLPLATGFFTPRIQATASGASLDIENVQFEVRFLNNYPNSPFGSLLRLPSNIPLNIGGDTGGSIYIQYSGKGFVSFGQANETLPVSPRLSWVAETNWNGESIQVDGNVSIATVVVANSPIPIKGVLGQEAMPTSTVNTVGPIVFARGFAPGYSLSDSSGTYSPIPTLDGMNLFQNVKPGSYQIEFSSLFPMVITYMLALGFVFVLFLASAGTTMWKRRGRRQIDDKVGESF
jgi:hypothetical protein